IAFVLFKWETNGDAYNINRDVKYSDIYVLNNWREIFNGSTSRVTSLSDARLTKLTDGTKFCWNPSWNTDGTVVTWSQAPDFNFRNYYNKPDQITGDYTETLNNAQFTTYMCGINANGQLLGEPQSLTASENSQENEYLFDWSKSGDTMVSIVKNDSGYVIRIMRVAPETVIRQNGGILFDNGKTVLVVPANETRAANTKIGVSAVAMDAFTDTNLADTTKVILTGSARAFYPSGLEFGNTVTVVLYYTLNDLNNMVSKINQRFGTNFSSGAELDGTVYEYFMSLYWWNPVTKQWEDYGGVVNPTNNLTAGYYGYITAQTNHFSIYAIGGYFPFNPDSSYLTIIGKDTALADGNDSVYISVTLR
ncbi:MAG TPA: hypothetical protein PLJ38_12105, partial [bacterium]|nr:hypothetical protein [bacterium]